MQNTSSKPLMYDNEPARHKLLDIIGDIVLVGAFVEGSIIATCPGHKINVLFAKTIHEYYMVIFCQQVKY